MTVETIDLGEFNLDEQIDNKPEKNTSFDTFVNKNKNTEHPFVKSAMKDLVKTSKKKKTDEEIKKSQELILILSRYGQSKRFSEHLKSMGFNLSVSHLKQLETDELEELLSRARICLNNKTVSNLFEDTCFGVIQTGEALVVNTKLGEKFKIQGLTELLRNDSNTLDLLEMLSLDYQSITHVRPEIRLVYTIVSSAMKIHSVNSLLERRLSLLKKNEEEEKVEEKEEKDEEKVEEQKVEEQKVEESQEETKQSQEQSILSFE